MVNRGGAKVPRKDQNNRLAFRSAHRAKSTWSLSIMSISGVALAQKTLIYDQSTPPFWASRALLMNILIQTPDDMDRHYPTRNAVA